MHLKCSKLSRKLLKNELKACAFRPDFERSPRESVFETDNIEHLLFTLNKPSTFDDLQNPGTGTLNSVYRDRDSKLRGTRLFSSTILISSNMRVTQSGQIL